METPNHSLVGIDHLPSVIEDRSRSAFSPYIQKGIHSHALTIPYRTEAVVEMAIARFLYPDPVYSLFLYRP